MLPSRRRRVWSAFVGLTSPLLTTRSLDELSPTSNIRYRVAMMGSRPVWIQPMWNTSGSTDTTTMVGVAGAAWRRGFPVFCPDIASLCGLVEALRSEDLSAVADDAVVYVVGGADGDIVFELGLGRAILGGTVRFDTEDGVSDWARSDGRDAGRAFVVRTPEQQVQAMQTLASGEHPQVVVDATHAWKIIPLENLIAAAQQAVSTATLMAVCDSMEMARVFIDTLDVGVGGLVYRTDSLSELDQLKSVVGSCPHDATFADPANRVELQEAVVRSVRPIGTGDRGKIFASLPSFFSSAISKQYAYHSLFPQFALTHVRLYLQARGFWWDAPPRICS
mmetsp:Transcript_15904/g.31892  ORF Transcript_15904/g.31892 Transcript_15904/m.31892 type:complete len:335 (+) Transcript_15904:3892-4896(+)